jgi:hypothetical protein
VDTIVKKDALRMNSVQRQGARQATDKPWLAEAPDSLEHAVSMLDRQTPSDENREDKGSVGATLHLDGAALGRWTIRHIERALAKPSSGMTGVDPRATMPRGHISPF